MHQYTENQQQVLLAKKLKWVVKAHSSSNFWGKGGEPDFQAESLFVKKRLNLGGEAEFWGL